MTESISETPQKFPTAPGPNVHTYYASPSSPKAPDEFGSSFTGAFPAYSPAFFKGKSIEEKVAVRPAKVMVNMAAAIAASKPRLK